MRIWEIIATQPELVGQAVTTALAGAGAALTYRKSYDIVPTLDGLVFVYGLRKPFRESVLTITQNLATGKTSLKLGITRPERMTFYDENGDGLIERVDREGTEPIGCLDHLYHEELYRFRSFVRRRPPLIELPSRVRFHMML